MNLLPQRHSGDAQDAHDRLVHAAEPVRRSLLAEWGVEVLSVATIEALLVRIPVGELRRQIERAGYVHGDVPRFTEPQFAGGHDSLEGSTRHVLQPFFPRESGSRRAC